MMEYLSLQKVTAMHRDEIQEAVSRVVDSGWYLQGRATAQFEADYARYIGTRHCVGCGNGLDALSLIFRAYKEMGVLHEGDEVIVSANTYIASILAISENGLRPVLVEPSPGTLQLDETRIEEAVTERTRALLLVHLYGRCAWTEGISDICTRHHLRLIEDNAQGVGCRLSQFKIQNSKFKAASSGLKVPSLGLNVPSSGLNVQSLKPKVPSYRLQGCALGRCGSLGSAAAHSFYPGKNLGALGDAGAVTTDDEELARVVRALGNYGSSRKYVFPYRGMNSRIDEIQAAVLGVKLKYLDEENRRRKAIADHYYSHIDNPELTLPGWQEWATAAPLGDGMAGRDEACIYHIFPVLCRHRDELQAWLTAQGIGTMIHYPIPPHLQDCYPEWHGLSLPVTESIAAHELSIPCNQTMTDADVAAVCRALNAFRGNKI
ncbi:DegT/DnrJ/EryC1/StrS family aminotransferase [[Hallella] seregens]|uniref:DegT/DnrJ/EryC1/StrS family aminotransferase n=1 Tax=Hallella seregens ATCC 51272 TaxID=1336250 RepID=A0ABV5ZJZ4_9BACT|nr:DegT/DnrJ/EryC1/StrS family aminotransferase [Hallella seregens]